jgi:ATP-dependent DNA ligase
MPAKAGWKHVSKPKGSPYRSGRSPDWLKMKNPTAPAVQRETGEDLGKAAMTYLAKDLRFRRLGRPSDGQAVRVE